MKQKNKVLIHTCCAPCLCYCSQKLTEENFQVTVFWYNLNIHPSAEYRLRLEALKKYQSLTGLEIVWQDRYDFKEWLSYVEEGVKKDKRSRCELCYHVRLTATARHARENNFDYFTTTLLYSKYQFHDEIKDLGEKISREYNIPFLYYDFRTGWQRGIEISRSLGLYRQKYCGCIFSENNNG